MTNAEIIATAQFRLRATGQIGNDEEIHTYAAWKKLGYQVLRGEKAVCKLTIWKPVSKKAKDGEDEEAGKESAYMMLKTAHFFSSSQVDYLEVKK